MAVKALREQIRGRLVIGLLHNRKELPCGPGDGVVTRHERSNHFQRLRRERRRIAQGSGTTVADVNRVIKQYVELRKMLKMFKGKKGLKIPKVFPF